MLKNNLKKLRVSNTFLSANDVREEVQKISGKTMTSQQLSHYESNKSQPRLLLHKAFARALNCEVADLFYIDKKIKNTKMPHQHKAIVDFYNLEQN